MKHLHKSVPLLLTAAGCISALCGCGPKEPAELKCPFTEITWENTLDEINELEGEVLDSYESVYDGMTYSYEKEYDGMDGTIKYIFDNEEKLVSMAWVYIPESNDDRDEVYDKLRRETEDLYGESGFTSNMGTAMGEVWYLEDGNIIISVMSTGVNEAIQYQFVHPDVASEKPE